MKLLALLLFISNISLAQSNVMVKNMAGEKLIGVSIYEISAQNSLISISDSAGAVIVNLQENKSYLFHLLGYVDKILSTEEIKKQPTIILQNSIYQLNEVLVNKTKLKKNKLVNKSGNFSIAEGNSVKTTFERVVALKIEKPGFLKEFRLFAHQNFSGQVRVFRFILLSSDKNKPGKSLIGNTVKGILKEGKMIFTLDTLGVFLEKGDYFIGYETQNNGKIDPYAREIKSKSGVRLEYPMIFIEGKMINSPTSFSRSNLKDWYLLDYNFNKKNETVAKKYIDLAYELEMRVPVAN